MAKSLPKTALTPPTLKDAARWKGLRVGLLGGSFNPPHQGHMHIARMARIKFGLDFVWWIVTPQNPLKDKKNTAPYDKRFKKVEEITAKSPKQMATHVERDLGTQYTYETISELKKNYPSTEFIWICGMDNALIFHKWDKWQTIIDTMPMVFIARPPAGNLVRNCPLRLLTSVSHRHNTDGVKTDLTKPCIYWLEGTKMLDISSTKIRNKKI